MLQIKRLLNQNSAERVFTRVCAERLIGARHRFAAQNQPSDQPQCTLRDAEAHYTGTIDTQRPALHIPGMEKAPCKQPQRATEIATSKCRSKTVMKRELINQGLMYALVGLFAMIAVPLYRLFTL
jgi:hypothetical protein